MHISVLLEESVNALNLKDDSVVVDATLGYAGHSSLILKRIRRGCLFAFDQDSEAIAYSKTKLETISDNFTIIKSNFVNMKEELSKRNIESVDAVLFDLGVSSPQLDNDYRGFSYHKEAPLDMRMDLDSDFSAYNVVNEYSYEKLVDIFFRYAEDKYSRSIAKNIVKQREIKPIETTLELAEIIKDSVPEKVRRKKHPAKVIFQAIRIEVNHELDILESSIKDAISLLSVGGRCAVITFHSLEDKIVKKVFKEMTEVNELVKGLPEIPEEYQVNYKLVFNKAIKPSKEEIENNNRSRSSTLRVIERIK